MPVHAALPSPRSHDHGRALPHARPHARGPRASSGGPCGAGRLGFGSREPAMTKLTGVRAAPFRTEPSDCGPVLRFERVIPDVSSRGWRKKEARFELKSTDYLDGRGLAYVVRKFRMSIG